MIIFRESAMMSIKRKKGSGDDMQKYLNPFTDFGFKEAKKLTN